MQKKRPVFEIYFLNFFKIPTFKVGKRTFLKKKKSLTKKAFHADFLKTRPSSWTNHKRVASSITRDVADVELWDDEIKERERLQKEQEQEK